MTGQWEPTADKPPIVAYVEPQTPTRAEPGHPLICPSCGYILEQIHQAITTRPENPNDVSNPTEAGYVQGWNECLAEIRDQL